MSYLKKTNSMTEKVQKIREEIAILKSNLIHGACASQIAMETRCKEEAYNEVLAILDTTQEEPINYDKLNTMLDDALAKETKESLNERLGISQKEYGKIVDGCIYGKEPELVYADDLPKEEPVNKDFELALAEMIDNAQKCVVEPLVVAAQWKDELIKLAKSEEPVGEEWIEELRTKLDSMSKEDFKKVFDKYAVDFNEDPVSGELEQAIDTYLKSYWGGEKEKQDWPFLKKLAIHFAKWQKEQINEVLLSEVLPCFMHGGEADEVVAKLEEVLNQKKYEG